MGQIIIYLIILLIPLTISIQQQQQYQDENELFVIEKYYNLLDENTTLKLFTNATNCTLKSINLYTAIKCPYTVILVENSQINTQNLSSFDSIWHYKEKLKSLEITPNVFIALGDQHFHIINLSIKTLFTGIQQVWNFQILEEYKQKFQFLQIRYSFHSDFIILISETEFIIYFKIKLISFDLLEDLIYNAENEYKFLKNILQFSEILDSPYTMFNNGTGQNLIFIFDKNQLLIFYFYEESKIINLNYVQIEMKQQVKRVSQIDFLIAIQKHNETQIQIIRIDKYSLQQSGGCLIDNKKKDFTLKLFKNEKRNNEYYLIIIDKITLQIDIYIVFLFEDNFIDLQCHFFKSQQIKIKDKLLNDVFKLGNAMEIIQGNSNEYQRLLYIENTIDQYSNFSFIPICFYGEILEYDTYKCINCKGHNLSQDQQQRCVQQFLQTIIINIYERFLSQQNQCQSTNCLTCQNYIEQLQNFQTQRDNKICVDKDQIQSNFCYNHTDCYACQSRLHCEWNIQKSLCQENLHIQDFKGKKENYDYNIFYKYQKCPQLPICGNQQTYNDGDIVITLNGQEYNNDKFQNIENNQNRIQVNKSQICSWYIDVKQDVDMMFFIESGKKFLNRKSGINIEIILCANYRSDGECDLFPLISHIKNDELKIWRLQTQRFRIFMLFEEQSLINPAQFVIKKINYFDQMQKNQIQMVQSFLICIFFILMTTVICWMFKMRIQSYVNSRYVDQSNQVLLEMQLYQQQINLNQQEIEDVMKIYLDDGIFIVRDIQSGESLPFGQTECSFCLDSLSLDRQVVQLQCGHIFHKDCFKKWIQVDIRAVKCPVCQWKFEEVHDQQLIIEQ